MAPLCLLKELFAKDIRFCTQSMLGSDLGLDLQMGKLLPVGGEVIASQTPVMPKL